MLSTLSRAVLSFTFTAPYSRLGLAAGGPSVIGPLHKQRDILAGLPDLGYTDADTGRLTVTR
jgi:hypothetical protein